ncbi:MAG: TolC family protein [Phycisphaerales bacterium]|nr:TolC family protein [Phycisphaerales bacterium]
MSAADRITTWALQLAGLGALGALAACQSLDPSADVARAGATVEARTGVRPGWDAAPGGQWDGSSSLGERAAVTIALRQSPMIRAELETIGAARADLVQSGLLPNPMLSVALGFPLGGEQGAVSIGASAVQQFSAIWLLPSRERGARAALDERVLRVSDGALRLAAEVRSMHAAIEAGQREHHLLESRAGLAIQSLAIANERSSIGESTVPELAAAQALAASAEAELIAHEAALEADKRRLLAMMGAPGAAADFTAVLDADDMFGIGVAGLDEPAVIALATNQRLDVAAALAAADVRASDVDIAALSRVPIGAGVDARRDEMKFEMAGPMFELEVPIFDDGSARIAKASAEHRSARWNAAATLHRAVGEARIAWIQWRAASRARETYETGAARPSESAYEVAKESAAAGLVSGEELYAMESELIETRMKLVEFELTERLARIELDRAVGGSLRCHYPRLGVGSAQRVFGRHGVCRRVSSSSATLASCSHFSNPRARSAENFSSISSTSSAVNSSWKLAMPVTPGLK